MIHEYFGLPGAGKSYISAKHAKMSGLPLIVTQKKILRVFFAACYAMRHPVISWFFYHLLLRENTQNKNLRNYKIKRLYIDTLACEGRALFHKHSIIDQGWFQFLISIYEREVAAHDLLEIRKRLSNKNYIVHIVNADNGVRKQRMKKRGRVPRDHQTNYDLNRIQEIWSKNHVTMSKFIRMHYQSNVVEN